MPMQRDPTISSVVHALRGIDFGHHLESLAIAFTVCVTQTLLVFGLRVDSWMHETANFLRHYEDATLAARTPINFVIAFGFGLNLVIVVIARRFKEARADD